MSYKKYLKYKAKYLALKQLGGSIGIKTCKPLNPLNNMDILDLDCLTLPIDQSNQLSKECINSIRSCIQKYYDDFFNYLCNPDQYKNNNFVYIDNKNELSYTIPIIESTKKGVGVVDYNKLIYSLNEKIKNYGYTQFMDDLSKSIVTTIEVTSDSHSQESINKKFNDDRQKITTKFNNDRQKITTKFNNDQEELNKKFHNTQEELNTQFSKDQIELKNKTVNNQEELKKKTNQFNTLIETYNINIATLHETYNINIATLHETYNKNKATLQETYNKNMDTLDEKYNTDIKLAQQSDKDNLNKMLQNKSDQNKENDKAREERKKKLFPTETWIVLASIFDSNDATLENRLASKNKIFMKKLLDKFNSTNKVIVSISLEIFDLSSFNVSGHANSLVIYKYGEGNNMHFLVIRTEPHRHTNIYCRNSVRKAIREIFKSDPRFYYKDYVIQNKNKVGLQLFEEKVDAVISSDFDNLKSEYKIMSPLQGNSGFCASWTMYTTMILLLNQDKNLDTIGNYLGSFGLPSTTDMYDPKYTLHKHIKLYRSIIFVVAFIYKTSKDEYEKFCKKVVENKDDEDETKKTNVINKTDIDKLTKFIVAIQPELETFNTILTNINTQKIFKPDNMALLDPHYCMDSTFNHTEFCDQTITKSIKNLRSEYTCPESITLNGLISNLSKINPDEDEHL
jgi:hypothetical protein